MSADITVTLGRGPVTVTVAGTEKAITATFPSAWLATAAALKGPPGTKGDPGDGSRFVFAQPVAAAVWTVAHNLGHRPQVTVWSPGGVEVIAAVVHISNNVLNILFDTPQAGSAQCL